jgi:hypothetical protein
MNRTAAIATIVTVLLLADVPAAQAADGWFAGIQVAPWMTRADALLNLDRADAAQLRKARPGQLPPVRRFDLELAYAADAGADGNGTPGRPMTGGRDFRLAGVGTWSLGDKFGVTGRLGAYRGDVDAGTVYRLTPDAGLHPTYGMGLRYDVSANLRLQGGWDRYHLGQSLHPGDSGVDLLTIGLKYRF